MNELININNRLMNPLFNTISDFVSFADEVEGKRSLRTAFEDEGDHYSLLLEVPGFSKADLDLSVSPEKEVKLKGAIDTKYYKNSIDRTFSTPVDANTSKVQARLEHGILFISIPKVERAKNSKVKIT